MYQRRWPVIATALVAILVVAAVGWMAGRASAPEASAQAQQTHGVGAVRMIDGVPVGIERSRAGALAAADNYVALTTETVVQDPRRFEALVRRVFAPAYQAQALREGEEARAAARAAVANYEEGGRAVAIIAARRLDAYAGERAVVTTWRSGVIWGPAERPAARWFLTETSLRWKGDRWIVEKIDDSGRAAPSPLLKYSDPASTRTKAFERELREMTAPSYGVVE